MPREQTLNVSYLFWCVVRTAMPYHKVRTNSNRLITCAHCFSVTFDWEFVFRIVGSFKQSYRILKQASVKNTAASGNSYDTNIAVHSSIHKLRHQTSTNSFTYLARERIINNGQTYSYTGPDFPPDCIHSFQSTIRLYHPLMSHLTHVESSCNCGIAKRWLFFQLLVATVATYSSWFSQSFVLEVEVSQDPWISFTRWESNGYLYISELLRNRLVGRQSDKYDI